MSAKQINEIAEELDSGMKCYVNKETGEVSALLDSDDMYGDTELWEEELEKIKKEWKDYIVIEKMSSREGFEVMGNFVNTVSDRAIRERLMNALNGRKPFRSFRDVVDFKNELRQQWFDHKAKTYQEYVRMNLRLHFELPDETPYVVEEPQVLNKINFEGKTFSLMSNSIKGKVDFDTTFKFKQEDNLVTADYYGGAIKYGKIIAALENDKLDMRYQCMTKGGELKAGKAIADIDFDPNGKMRLFLNWEWLDGSGEKGASEYVED